MSGHNDRDREAAYLKMARKALGPAGKAAQAFIGSKLTPLLVVAALAIDGRSGSRERGATSLGGVHGCAGPPTIDPAGWAQPPHGGPV